MKVIVVGPGRIGMALGKAVRASGHEVVFLGLRDSPSHACARASGFAVFSDTTQVGWTDVDLILLAVASENPDRSETYGALDLLAQHSGRIPVASIVGPMNLCTLSTIFGNRSVARFFCSAAVGDPSSTRFYDENSDPESVRLLEDALPSSVWHSVSSDSFDRYGTLLVAAALVCIPFLELGEALGPLAPDEAAFLLDTLTEARRLLATHGNDPAAAVSSALTPGGMTRRFSRRMFRHEWTSRLAEGHAWRTKK